MARSTLLAFAALGGIGLMASPALAQHHGGHSGGHGGHRGGHSGHLSGGHSGHFSGGHSGGHFSGRVSIGHSAVHHDDHGIVYVPWGVRTFYGSRPYPPVIYSRPVIVQAAPQPPPAVYYYVMPDGSVVQGPPPSATPPATLPPGAPPKADQPAPASPVPADPKKPNGPSAKRYVPNPVVLAAARMQRPAGGATLAAAR